MNFLHYPVMNKEVIEIFSQTGKRIFIDCTIGLGGHAFFILTRFKNSKVIAIDCDGKSLKRAKKNLSQFGARVSFHKINFLNIFETIQLVKEDISGILIDPGISLYQLKERKRGFSHSIEAKLDMRKDESLKLNAHDVVNSFSEMQLSDIFRKYGELKRAGELAKRIIETRLFTPIDSTAQLRELVEKIYAWKSSKGKTHPAAKVFQALRIFVNKELEGIEDFIKQIPEFLKTGARMVFLTYHSLEDRIVKQGFNFLQQHKKIQILKPFPRFPSLEEVKANTPSRSARLRAAEIR